jgi:pimeloyl-ACP methyl ester carboxylesterase
MKKFVAISLFVLSLLFNVSGHNRELGKLIESPCPFKVPEALSESGKFSYGYMKVPEFHSNPDGKSIELAVAIFKCQSDSATHEPLILITGGPGNSDIQGFLPLLFGNLGKFFLDNRDVVIIELRGLKYSRPNLFCPELDNLQMDLLTKNLTPEKTIDVYMDTLQTVYKRFERQGVNLSAFNDYEIANDIVFVMEKLNYEKFSVFGASFGTLVVQHLLLNHSEHIVSAVMNAVVDVNHGFANMHTNSINTMDKIFEKCEKDEELKQAYPDLKNRFLALIEKLNHKPDTIMAKKPGTGTMHKIVLNGNRLSVWTFSQMYWNTQLPLTLSNLLNGDYSEIIKTPQILFPLSNFSNGLSLSTFTSLNMNGLSLEASKDTLPLAVVTFLRMTSLVLT